jgi:glycosyltransferase involved in cell wall biosynthesis
MRLLDLGAHDGFVGTWLAKQVEGLHIDGVEANSQAVRIANERAEKNGIAGRYIQGLAEDAATHFDAGSYDAVAAFELIEHVPDVNQFLDVCEQMCNDSGRVYLSTPNGTFGEGNNPHHLRAYRAVDLFELCRRRGTVCDMLAGDDGVTVISYSPRSDEYPELAIYCGPGWEKWHPADIATKGLGGSETAAVRLAEALSSTHTVTVYGECDYCAWRQVQFKPHHSFDPLEARSVVIASRTPQLVDRPINADQVLLWMHDTDYGDAVTPERIEKFDHVLALSEWHSRFLRERYPFIEDKIRVFGNAIEPRYFSKPSPKCGRDDVALYTSSPDRGLDLILKLWPMVREQVPDAELRFAYASVYQRVADQQPALAAFRDRVLQLADQPGVINLGSLSQPQVAEQMMQAAVWLAPSINTNVGVHFEETYCIGAQEAAAGGAVVIASDWGALPERMEQAVNSISIGEGGWESKEWQEAWVSAIVQGMTTLFTKSQILL